MRAHEQVLAWVEGELAAGRIGVGDRLPAERALGQQLGVSRPSVREAVRVLEAMGVVRARTGSGPEAGAVVVDGPSTAIGSSLGAGLRLHTATTRLPVADVVATRVLLETWAVAAAAARDDDARAELLARARALLGAMDDERLPAEEFVALDAQLHVALAACAGNAVVELVMTSLREAVQAYVSAGVAALPDWPATCARLRREHRALHAAVAAGRAEEAAALVRAHVEGFAAEAGLHPGTPSTTDPTAEKRT